MLSLLSKLVGTSRTTWLTRACLVATMIGAGVVEFVAHSGQGLKTAAAIAVPAMIAVAVREEHASERNADTQAALVRIHGPLAPVSAAAAMPSVEDVLATVAPMLGVKLPATKPAPASQVVAPRNQSEATATGE